MQLGSREHQEMISSFEMNMKATHLRVRYEKEPKAIWPSWNIYQDGHTNDLFLVFAAGYANARCVYTQG